MSTTNILDLNNRIDALEKNSGGGSADSAKRSDIATEFSATTAYTAGCFVYYEGKLYQFNADHAAGAWDPTDVVEANVTDQIVSNKAAIDGLTASDVAYDNTDSGLTATNVQNAVDELSESYPADKVILSDGVTSVEDALDAITVYKDLTNLPANGEITSLVASELANGYKPAYASVIVAQQLTDVAATPMISSLGGNRFFALFLAFSGSTPSIVSIDSSAIIRVFFMKTT